MIVVDFETAPIEPRPAYPPEPVGVALRRGRRSEYLAWGHPSGNNSTKAKAASVLRDAWRSGDDLLFHHAAFDLAVAEERMGLKTPRWDRVHDTLPLLFLDDPYAPDYSLKPSAERLLGLPPEERDLVEEWLYQNQPIEGVRIKKKSGAKYVAHAPGSVVAPYARGDVDRTEKLFRHVFPRVKKAGMSGAYDRERRLLPVLMAMERRGVRVDTRRLEEDVVDYRAAMARLDAWLRKRLRSKDLNLDSGDQLAAALVRARLADPGLLGYTATGKLATNKEALDAGVTNRVVKAALVYRSQLETCLGTFMEPWLETARASGGLIYTRWSPTRRSSGGGFSGARTGRLSSSPNFQNLAKEFKSPFAAVAAPVDLPPLPLVRGYVVPLERGDALLDRDYNQQEIRILAHFCGGSLIAAYEKDPWVDFHDAARTMINEMLGTSYERKPIKNTGFGLLYGMGVGKLALKNDTTVEVAKRLKEAYLARFTELRDLYTEMKRRAAAGEPLRTWGGRVYYCEPPRLVDGRIRSFDYKMVNTLIQGSASDCTKDAMTAYHEASGDGGGLLLTAHDEILASRPAGDAARWMRRLEEAMSSTEFLVPMHSEGKWSKKSWAALTPFDAKGEIVAKGLRQ